MLGCVPSLRTDDLQQMLAKMRKGDPILAGSREPGANPRVVSLTRSRRETVTFRHPFRIKGIERQLQAGAYEGVTGEELIESLFFPCFRRLPTTNIGPPAPPHQTSTPLNLSYSVASW